MRLAKIFDSHDSHESQKRLGQTHTHTHILEKSSVKNVYAIYL